MATTLIHVSRDDLKEKIERGEEFVLVDALSPLSYATSHLPGAISMPPGHVDELASRRIPDRSTEVVDYCTSSTCDSSVIVGNRLIELGYRNVRHYAEGKRTGWKRDCPSKAAASSSVENATGSVWVRDDTGRVLRIRPQG